MNFSGLTTQYAPRLNQGLSAAKNTIADGTQYKSQQYRKVPTRCRLRYREDCFKIEIMKKTFPGSADSGKVLGKIITIPVGTVYNRRRYRMGLTATIIDFRLILPCPLRYRHHSGQELHKFSSGYMNKKIRKKRSVRVYSVSRIFLLQLSAMKYLQRKDLDSIQEHTELLSR